LVFFSLSIVNVLIGIIFAAIFLSKFSYFVKEFFAHIIQSNSGKNYIGQTNIVIFNTSYIWFLI